MAYTTINKSTDYFNTKLYTGTGSNGNAITGVGFQPDLIWIKDRINAYSHRWYDAIRGVNSAISSDNDSAASQYAQYGQLESIDSDGFTVGQGSSSGAAMNDSGDGHVSWNWKAGTTSGITTNASTDTTPSSYSFNQTSGLSILKYSGSGSTPTKIAHGLGVAPKMIIVKRLTGAADWVVGHDSLAWTKYIYLSSNAASVTAGGAAWENTAPDSINFTVGNNTQVNASGSTYIAYCFAEKTGYSKFGSYVGNGNADGNFIYTGFKPAFVMVKTTTLSTESWFMYDNTRSESNPTNDALLANLSNTEYANSGTFTLDLLSNGFKLKNNDGSHNGSGQTYIYMCFAEAPLVGSNNVPCTAR